MKRRDVLSAGLGAIALSAPAVRSAHAQAKTLTIGGSVPLTPEEQTLNLQLNAPEAEYMAAVISSVMSTKDKVPFFVSHCSSMGIQVLPPDVNISDHSFVVDGTDIRFGLDAVKNVGHSAVEAIIRAREERPFESLWDFCERVDNRAVNKRSIECLIKCGAFDSLPGSRQGMLEKFPDAAAAGAKAQSDAMLGQESIFSLDGAEDSGGSGSHEPISEVEFEQKELLALEKETMGTFLSSHPLDGLKEAILAEADCSIGDLAHQKDGSRVKIGGLVTAYKKVRTRAGKQIAFATLSDIEHDVELMLFNLEDSEKQQLVQMDEVVMVRGTIDQSEEGAKLKVRDAELFNPSAAQIEKAFDVRTQLKNVDRIFERVFGGIHKYSGALPLESQRRDA